MEPFDELYDAGYEHGHEDGFVDAIEEQANVNILEDAAWRLVQLIVARVNDGPSEDNFLEEAIEDTFEEFMSAADEEGAEEDEYVSDEDTTLTLEADLREYAAWKADNGV